MQSLISMGVNVGLLIVMALTVAFVVLIRPIRKMQC